MHDSLTEIELIARHRIAERVNYSPPRAPHQAPLTPTADQRRSQERSCSPFTQRSRPRLPSSRSRPGPPSSTSPR